jgi:uncharacterized protein YgiM (DUF1202 family)
MKPRKASYFGFLFFFFALLVSLAFPGQSLAYAPDYKIEINKSTNKLYLYDHDKVIKTYPVATGRTDTLTPEGTFPIVVKIVDPGWKGIPGGDPRNPLGARWNGLSVNGDNGRTYGIHGTNNPSSIGTHASSGCVRMYNKDVIELYNTIYEGTPVWIHSGTSNGVWRGDPNVGLKPASGTVKITASSVNARTGPSTGSFVITTLSKGTVLPLTGVSGDWYQVKLSNGRTAFVHKDYAVKTAGGTPTPAPSFSPASGQVQITVDVANVRQAPSLSSTVLMKAKYGTKFTLTGISSEWYRVNLANGSTAYLHHSVAKRVTTTQSKVTVIVNLANIRSKPSLSAPIVQQVPYGTVLTKVGMSGDFHQIKLSNGQIAYIYKSVVK